MRMISLPLGGLALAGLLLGCASTPDTSGTLPPVTSAPAAAPGSATPTASPTPTLPPVPPEAMSETRESRQAFVRYWYEVLNLAYDTRDATLIERLSDDECAACAGYAENIRVSTSEGETYEGGHLRVENAIAAPDDSELPVVLVDLQSEPGTLLASDGSIKEVLDAYSQSAQVQLQRVDDSWVFYGIADI